MLSKNQIKRYLQWAAWVLVVALLVVLYTKNGDNNVSDDEQSKIMGVEGSNADLNYESVVLPRGLSDRVVK